VLNVFDKTITTEEAQFGFKELLLPVKRWQ